jgi:hypothetical protein
MLASIPASEIVTVLPSVLGAGGTAMALNATIISDDVKFVAKEYSNADAVGNDYGTTSDKYKFAQIYFNGFTGSTVKPSALFISKYSAVDSAAKLTGASLRSMSLDQLKAITGAISVTIDGVLATGTVDLSAATSFSNAATLIATALTAAVTFDTQLQSFVIASGTTGATSSISFATGAAAEALALTELTGSQLDNVTTVDTATTAMKRLTNYTLNLSTIVTETSTALTDDIQKEIATWVSLQNHRYWLVKYGEEPTALIANSTTNFAGWVAENNVADVTCVYGTFEHAALCAGYAASLNFSELNGRTTMDFRSTSTLAPSVTDVDDANALESNGYAYYGAFATANDRFIFLRNSIVSGEFKWVDAYLNQIYFNSQLQLAQITGLVANKSIPYNEVGKSKVRASAQDPINEMLNFGGIQTGVSLSEQQKSIINNEAGVDAATIIFNQGYYLMIRDATAQVRAVRGSFPIKLWYTDGGSVHSINIASINVQ